MKRSVTLYFGSFNPIHLGHTAVAEWVAESGYADEVWLVVSPQNPLKSPAELAPEADRLAMARLATEAMPRLRVSDVEFSLPRPSYTIDTVDRLKRSYPETDFSILVGADIVPQIESWKEWDRLLLENRFYVYPREGYTLARADMTLLGSAPVWDYCSTDIRRIATAGGDFSDMVAPQVLTYIKTHKLWKI